MILDFVFKYFWLFVILIIWLIFAYYSIKNFIFRLKDKNNENLLDAFESLDDYSIKWLCTTIAFCSLCSFLYFLLGE